MVEAEVAEVREPHHKPGTTIRPGKPGAFGGGGGRIVTLLATARRMSMLYAARYAVSA